MEGRGYRASLSSRLRTKRAEIRGQIRVLDGRDWLYDVERMGVGIIGIVLIEPMGIEMTYVFDVAANGMQLLSSASIHGKSERTARMSESIRVSAAVKLARLAVEKETSPLRDGMLQLRYGCCQSTE
ncbi:hypothetical protein FACS1894167_13460 [Synergistales bacterium]|nr:hypothetical protein FACS1894167_13460 [Synergistales bacterium]